MSIIRKTFSLIILALTLAACNTVKPSIIPIISPTTTILSTKTLTIPTVLPPTLTTLALPTAPATLTPAEQPTQVVAGKETAEILKEMGGYPCSETSLFTCIKLNVPLDQLNPKPGETIEVVFAVLPASGERKGMFVTAVGGPGYSGLSAADSYTSAFDPSITEQFDIVFFDQRGIAASGNIQCPQAAATFYRSDWSAITPAQESNLLKVAETFANDCVKAIADTRLLPYLSTEHAVRDLEAFRQEIQDHGSATADKFWLYGESYGTQFAQTYAANFPQHLAGMILDGTIDLTLSGIDWYRGEAQASENVLENTLKDCNTQEQCAKDLGGDAVAAYDKLAAALSRQPQKFGFPLPSGKIQERTFTLADLDSATSGYIYTESSRLILLRSLAAAAMQENLAPLARVLYDSLAITPETLQAIPDPTYSDAVYYAVDCSEYAYPGDTPQAVAQSYLRAGDSIDQSVPHMAWLFYGELPCAFWPTRTKNLARPAPLVAEGIPTLVLGATGDPVTPPEQGRQVFSRLADGYLVTVQGGAHIVYGRGDACVDDLVTAFLADDIFPVQRETTCEGLMVDPYVTIAAQDARVYVTPLEALEAVDNEINFLPEYYDWDWETPTSVGCSFGGILSFEASENGVDFSLQNCAFSKGFILNGTGAYDSQSQLFTLDVNVSGLAEGRLIYTHQADGSLSVTGEYAGEPLDLNKSAEN